MISGPLLESLFTKPEPSLCDGCKFAFHVGGGFVSKLSGTYQQRYCPYPPPGKEGTNEGRNISISGYQECDYFQDKE